MPEPPPNSNQHFPPDREPPIDDEYDPYPPDSDDGMPDEPPDTPPPVALVLPTETIGPTAQTQDPTRYLQNVSKGAGYLPHGSPSPPPEVPNVRGLPQLPPNSEHSVNTEYPSHPEHPTYPEHPPDSPRPAEPGHPLPSEYPPDPEPLESRPEYLPNSQHASHSAHPPNPEQIPNAEYYPPRTTETRPQSSEHPATVVRSNSRPLPNPLDPIRARETAEAANPAPPPAYAAFTSERTPLPEVAYPLLTHSEARSSVANYDPNLDVYPPTPIEEQAPPPPTHAEIYPATEINDPHRMSPPEMERPQSFHPEARIASPSYAEPRQPEQPYQGLPAYAPNTRADQSYPVSPRSRSYPPLSPQGDAPRNMHTEMNPPQHDHARDRPRSAYPEVHDRPRSTYTEPQYPQSGYAEANHPPRTIHTGARLYRQPTPPGSVYQPASPGSGYGQLSYTGGFRQHSPLPRPLTHPEVAQVQAPKQKEIYIYGAKDPLFEFTNFSSRPIMYESKIYPTAEHLYQASKFLPHKPRLAEHIRTRYNNPRDALSEAVRFGAEVRKDWLHVNIAKMDEILALKFKQHRDLRKQLHETGDTLLIKNCPIDMFWGCGSEGTGQNQFGIALMRIREDGQLAGVGAEAPLMQGQRSSSRYYGE